MLRHQSQKSRLVARQANTAAFNTVAISQRVNLTTIRSRDIKRWTLVLTYLSNRLLFSRYQYLISLRSIQRETEVNAFMLTYYFVVKIVLIKMKISFFWNGIPDELFKWKISTRFQHPLNGDCGEHTPGIYHLTTARHINQCGSHKTGLKLN